MVIPAKDRDPRITPVGRFIRATRIDEVPQLINVLKGEIVFVGPRPERVEHVEKYFQGYTRIFLSIESKRWFNRLCSGIGKI